MRSKAKSVNPGSGPASRASTQRSGFTLVEVLVALFVLALVVVALGQGLRFGLMAWVGVTRASETAGTLDAVDRILRHLIAQADPGNATKAAPFSGSRGRLALVSTLPATPGVPERRVEVVLAQEDHLLVLRWRPHLHAQPLRPPPPFTEVALLRDLARLDLAYWTPVAGWSAAWSSTELPELVRIRLAFRDPARRRWADIVVAPELQQP